MSTEKTKRNRKIYLLSKLGGGDLSYRELQKRFRMQSVKTIYAIVKREHEKAP